MVSIIMPAYNAQETIKESIESVINQTYTKWELIIIDDCSTDNTSEIIKSYEDERIIYIRNKINLKVAKTRNKGIEKANYDYIAFLDSDDVWHHDKLEKQLSYMTNNSISFSVTDYELINNNGESTGKYIKSKTQNYKQLLRGSRIGCLTVMINKTKIKKIHFDDIGHEDYAQWLLILKENDIKSYSLNEILAKHRDTEGSLSDNKIKTTKWVWNIFRKVENKSMIFSMYLMMRYIINYIVKKKSLK